MKRVKSALSLVLLLAVASIASAGRYGFLQAESQVKQQNRAVASAVPTNGYPPMISLSPAMQLPHCAVILRFHGTQANLERAQYWLRFIEQDLQLLDISAALVCGTFTTQFIAMDECSDDNGRAWCPLSSAYTERNVADTAIVDIVITPSGLANTRNGVVFLHEQASALVLRHELGHALGFADEYSMHPRLAAKFCAGEFNFRPLNMVITENDWLTNAEYKNFISQLPWQRYIEQEPGVLEPSGIWRLGSQNKEKVGLFAAETCAGTGYYAWKPLAQKTFMQQHEIGVVPELYLQLIQQRLEGSL